jgi:hypothetical protein
MALARKKSGAQVGAPDKSNQLSEAGGPSQGECLAANSGNAAIAAPRYQIPGGGGESGEMMIPLTGPAEGELVHITCAQKNPARRAARRIIAILRCEYRP